MGHAPRGPLSTPYNPGPPPSQDRPISRIRQALAWVWRRVRRPSSRQIRPIVYSGETLASLSRRQCRVADAHNRQLQVRAEALARATNVAMTVRWPVETNVARYDQWHRAHRPVDAYEQTRAVAALYARGLRLDQHYTADEAVARANLPTEELCGSLTRAELVAMTRRQVRRLDRRQHQRFARESRHHLTVCQELSRLGSPVWSPPTPPPSLEALWLRARAESTLVSAQDQAAAVETLLHQFQRSPGTYEPQTAIAVARDLLARTRWTSVDADVAPIQVEQPSRGVYPTCPSATPPDIPLA